MVITKNHRNDILLFIYLPLGSGKPLSTHHIGNRTRRHFRWVVWDAATCPRTPEVLQWRCYLSAQASGRSQMGDVPSGKHTKDYGKWPFVVDLPSIEMVIFHSHVSLPEGNMNWSWLFRCSSRDVGDVVGGCSMDWKIHQKLMAFWSLMGGVLRYKRQFSNRPRSSQIHSFGKSLVISN